ncbi:MAG TPA: DUF427 domain-containing protein [Solirubrobacterales bacterium]|nr:DUF427 domain-containing protein [Solirubrobacterales bacterium]
MSSAGQEGKTIAYPGLVVPEERVAPVPRRLRGMLDDELVFDTTRALYFWDKPYYPQYNVPLEDVRGDFSEREFARVYRDGPAAGTVNFEWKGLDSWFEEDEQVFVHARNPYARVDALRSSRHLRVERDGVVLAEADAVVIVFETGLPPRHYFERTAVRFEHLEPSELVTECPYKGRTSEWWSVRTGETLHADLAWSYDFPTRQLLPIAGLVAFFDERVDTYVDGELLARPQTPFSERPDA